MADEQFTPEELALIKRLQNAPQPQLNLARLESIQQQVLQRVETTSWATPSTPPPYPASALIIALIVAAIAIGVALWAIALRPFQETPDVLPSPAMSSTEEMDALPAPTLAPTTPSVLNSLGVDNSHIVIEGPVQAIDLNVITIFDIDIQVDLNDPVLSQIEIDDVVRVEGEIVQGGRTIIIAALTITRAKPEPIIIDGGGSNALPPGCKITKKGNIKCTKK